MHERVDTEDFKGCSIEIVFDNFSAENPLTAWDHNIEIYTWYRRYTLGTHQPDVTPDAMIRELFYESDAFKSSPGESLLQFYRYWRKLGFTKNEIGALWDSDCDLPFWNREESSTFAGKLVDLLIDEGWAYTDVYMYEHSGIALSVGGGFSCPWDSGQLGFAIIRPEDRTGIWDGSDEKVYEYMRAFIEETYGAYLNGEIYGWITKDENGDEIDACWGYYGYKEFDRMKAEAKDSINAHLKFKAKEEVEEAERNSYALRNWEIPTYEATGTPRVIV